MNMILDTGRPEWSEIYAWFTEKYGQPFKWHGVVSAPNALKSPFKWATGSHMTGYNWSQPLRPCIWCGDEVYAWFLLKWS